jgi:hypothetical protein
MTLRVTSSIRVKLTNSTMIESEKSKYPVFKREISLPARTRDEYGGSHVGTRMSDEKIRPDANDPNPSPAIVAKNVPLYVREYMEGIL